MKKFIFLICIFLTMVFTGCTSNFQIDEDAVKEASDKITKVVADTVDNSITAERQESKTIKNTNIKELIVNSSVGDINIIHHESSNITINLKIDAKGESKEAAQNLADKFNYLIEENNDAVNINTEFENENIIENTKLKTDIEIKLPSYVNNMSIKTNVGNINIKDFNGNIETKSNVGDSNINNSKVSCNINTGVGKINIKQSEAIDSIVSNTNTGDINMELNDISKATNIAAKANVGNISLSIPDNSSYKAQIKEFMEDETIKTSGNQNTKIELTADVGNIELK